MRARDPELELSVYDEDASSSRRSVTLFHWVRLGLGAAWRRKALTVGIFVLGVVASFAYYRSRTPIYRVQAKVLAQRSQALPSGVRQLFEDVPTRSAWEMIHRRENLIAIIRQANLLAEGGGAPDKATVREWLLRMQATQKGDAAQKDPLDPLVLILDKLLVVTIDEGTIAIQFDWPDPQQAYAVVQAALQNFLEARHLQEVASIDEVISVLQGRAAFLRRELDEASEEARKRPARNNQVPPALKSQSSELVQLQSLLQAKQRAIQDVEEFRQRRLAELHTQLDQARNSLSDAHPTVIGLRQQIDALTRESPQLDVLREEERKLRKQYSDRLTREGPAPLPSSAAERGGSRDEDQRVRDVRLQYQQMENRVGAAQVERDAARAAFKYRYNVVWPPQVPREPYGPNPFKIVGAGILASALLALAAAAAPDVLRGRVVERWQVERALDIPVLAERKRS